MASRRSESRRSSLPSTADRSLVFNEIGEKRDNLMSRIDPGPWPVPAMEFPLTCSISAIDVSCAYVKTVNGAVDD